MKTSEIDVSGWWPPKVGDKLRHATLHGAGDGGVKKVDALLHVVSVGEHEGYMVVTTAEWFPSRRCWNYEVFRDFHAQLGSIWRDGEENPRL